MSPVKEPHYFAVPDGDIEHMAWYEPEFARTRAQYERLFEGSESFEAVGEASTTYLESDGAPERIAQALDPSRVRLIAVLRNPVDRAFSHFCDHRSDRSETIGKFRDAWKESARRAAVEKRIDWDYLAPGFYARHIENYLRFFARDRLKLILFEDLSSNSERLMVEVCEHLGIDSGFTFDTSARYNSSRLIVAGAIPALAGRRFNAIQKMIPQPLRAGVVSGVKSVVMKKPVLSAVDRSELIEIYREDIQALQTILGRSLDRWLDPGPES
jgi:hypothetical protein